MNFYRQITQVSVLPKEYAQKTTSKERFELYKQRSEEAFKNSRHKYTDVSFYRTGYRLNFINRFEDSFPATSWRPNSHQAYKYLVASLSDDECLF